MRHALIRFCLLSAGLAMILSAAGCGDCPLSSKTVTVIMDRQVEVRLPAPVHLNDMPIGKVTAVEADQSGHSALTVCLDKDAMESLSPFTAFYIKPNPVEDILVCEVLVPGELPTDKELVFPGFSEYAAFFGWRTETMLKQGMEDMLRMIEDAIAQ